MVFNPTLQTDVRFDQPVQQPDVFGAVGDILTGLGVFGQAGGGENLTDNEQFDRAVQSYQRMTGRNTPVEEWTPGELRSFQRYAGPRFGQRAVELQEDLGGMGRTEERARRDMIVEYRTSPRGQIDAGRAAQLYPDNPQAQEDYVIQQFAREQQRIVDHENLQRESEAAGYNQNINNRVWEIERDSIYTMANQAANALAEVYPRLAAGDSFQLGDIAPEIVATLGYNPTVSRDSIGVVAQQIRNNMFVGYTQQLRSIHPNQNITAPNEQYINEVFSSFDATLEAITNGVDPTQQLERMNSADQLRMREELQARGLGGLMPAFSLARGMDSRIQEMILTDAIANLGLDEAFRGIIRGDRAAVAQEVGDMSRREREAYEDLIISEISAVSTSPITDTNRANAFVNRLGTFVEAQIASGDRLSSTVYQQLLSQGVQQSIENSGLDGQGVVTSLIQHDLGLDIGDLQDTLNLNNYVINFDGSRLQLVSRSTLPDPTQVPTNEQTQLLDRINAKLQVLNGAGRFGTVEALITPLTEQYEQFQTQRQQQGTTQFTAPSNSTELMSNVYANATMNPTITMRGASQSTQPYAETRMRSMLEGPFQQLQEAFGAPLVINDAIAREGTSREVETPGSRHFHGDALDISIAGISDEELARLVDSALQAGFQGFGFGNGILHIDMGAPRGWAYGNTSFAGRPVEEMIAYVRDGVMPAPTLSTSTSPSAPVDPATERLIRSNINNDGGQLEWDEGEGAATNLQQFTQTPVEQEPTSTVTPEQTRNARENRAGDMRQRVPVRPEIQALIENLTQRGREEEILRFLEGLNE